MDDVHRLIESSRLNSYNRLYRQTRHIDQQFKCIHMTRRVGYVCDARSASNADGSGGYPLKIW